MIGLNDSIGNGMESRDMERKLNMKVLCVMGTRPEVIKMAPVVKALELEGIDAPVLVTAQHRDLLDQMSQAFGIHPQWDLDAMTPNQTLAGLTGLLIPSLDKVFRESKADAIIAQGDTATVFCAALASYYAGIPFGHVEAGLRSGDLSAPFPEEGMRKLTAVLARWHFAPTERAVSALLEENVQPERIFLTGNTVIDALLEMAGRGNLPWPKAPFPGLGQKLVLVTLHRRENFGEPFIRILDSIRKFAEAHLETIFIYPVHPNPNVYLPAKEKLGTLPNVFLVAPMDYPAMVHVLKRSYMAFTDSGGIQEEGPALGVPVIVFRDVTERPEAVSSGGAVLVGSDPLKFRSIVDKLWLEDECYASMAKPRFPFGKGDSGRQIASLLKRSLSRPLDGSFPQNCVKA